MFHHAVLLLWRIFQIYYNLIVIVSHFRPMSGGNDISTSKYLRTSAPKGKTEQQRLLYWISGMLVLCCLELGGEPMSISWHAKHANACLKNLASIVCAKVVCFVWTNSFPQKQCLDRNLKFSLIPIGCEVKHQRLCKYVASNKKCFNSFENPRKP